MVSELSDQDPWWYHWYDSSLGGGVVIPGDAQALIRSLQSGITPGDVQKEVICHARDGTWVCNVQGK